MADWTYQPEWPQDVDPEWQPTLVTLFEDLTEHRREKGVATRHGFSETYRVDATDMAAMLAFYATKRMVTPFTKVSYRPGEAAGHEVTVRFAEAFSFRYQGPEDYATTIRFVELVGE